jgi:signal peptidase I
MPASAVTDDSAPPDSHTARACATSPRTARLRAVVAAFWFTIVPAVLAGAAVVRLVPRALPGTGGFAAFMGTIGREVPVVLGVALFLLFASIARYWRSYLPWGHLTTALPEGAVATPNRGRLRESVATVVVVAVAGGAALGLRAWVVDSYTVLSASMLPTLAPGDALAGRKLAYRSPGRGDVIVFPAPAGAAMTDHEPERLIKRVIGLPGDRIAMTGGIPIINGWRVPTCDAGLYLYVAPDQDGTTLRAHLFVEFLEDQAYLTLQAPAARDFPGTYEVKPGEVFVLGDNRSNSADSRSWNGGTGSGVPLASVTARATWFLAGTHLDGRVDLGRLLRPLSTLGARLHVEGIDAGPLEQAVERCLREPPKVTHPPASST